ncbi:uncharacterized protein [Ptychodera flava]|uniref:uncharacterized protein n=1 Tax=Ptychodera flava TaxID=63121 RepID=UPI00396A447D
MLYDYSYGMYNNFLWNVNEANTDTCHVGERSSIKDRSVLILNDEWGISRGGISSLNRVIALNAKAAGFRVYVTVLKATDNEIKDAKDKEIDLLIANGTDCEDNPRLDWLKCYHKAHFTDIDRRVSNLTAIIGHVDLTFEAAFSIRDQLFPGVKVVLFFHETPDDIAEYKDDWTSITSAEWEESVLFTAKKADALFSVGPRVYDHFQLKLKGIGNDVRHYQYLPLPEDDFFRIRRERPKKNELIQILTMERLADVGRFRAYDIVALAMSRVTKEYHDFKEKLPIWIIRGIAKKDHDDIRKHILHTLPSGGKHLKLSLLPYGTKEQIITELKQSRLMLVTSRSEPFSMAGLEAIAAGIPVLITSNSGLAEFVKNEFPVVADSVIL